MTYVNISSPAVLVPAPVPGGVNAQDISFLQQASQANSLEITEAQLAMAGSPNPATREFAAWMLTDHGGVAATVVSLAQQLGVTLPASFTTSQQQEFAQLESQLGPGFDSAYAVQEISDHQQALALFEQEARDGQNPAITDFARQLIPVLQGHLNGAIGLANATTGSSLAMVSVNPTSPLPATGPASGTLSAQDMAFAQTAALANMAEVSEGQLAITQSGNAAASEFGQWMVGDHTAAQASLQTLASQEGVSLPTSPDLADQQELATLQSLNDGAFVSAYATSQIVGHVKPLIEFIQEAATGQDPAMRAYAATGVPALTVHLIGALELQNSTPGAGQGAAPQVDAALTDLLNSASASGNAALLTELRQVTALQPGFTYGNTVAAPAAGGALMPDAPPPTSPILAMLST